ncbi:MAG: OmpA family protein [Spirochaetales bacterium]|nr:OmpA family protein [Spirochaetales bacterium]
MKRLIVLILVLCLGCAGREVLTGCPPYQETVLFPSAFSPSVALNKLYERIKKLLSETGVKLETIGDTLGGEGIELKKETCPNGDVKAIIVKLDGDASFDTGSHRLKPRALELVNKVGQAMKENPATGARVSGHTDSVGSYNMNLGLSERRAGSVRDALTSGQGVESSRILSVTGYADTRNVVDTKAAEPRNRRVEIRVTPLKDGVETDGCACLPGTQPVALLYQ